MRDIFLSKTPCWGEFSCQVSDVLFGLVSFLSGAGLPVGFLISSLGFNLPVGDDFLNEFRLWGRSFCCVSDFMF